MTARTGRDTARRARVVIGGGIAGLATAALLGAEGWDGHRCFEARDELGGRAGSWEHDGFRFDTGPSWYLMPEVFDHFFRLLGTTAEQRARPGPPRPGVPRVHASPATRALAPTRRPVRAGMPRPRCSRAIEPGAGAKLDAYLDSAADAYELSVTRFLYDTYETTAGLRDPALLRRLPQLAPLLTRIARRATSSAGSPTRGCARSSATRPCSSAARRTACRACTT